MDTASQRPYIGKRSIEEAQKNLGYGASLILFVAPAAGCCYPSIGMKAAEPFRVRANVARLGKP